MRYLRRGMVSAAFGVLCLAVWLPGTAQDNPQRNRYWCAAKGEIHARPGPGCVPLFDEKDQPKGRDAAPVPKIENLESSIESFMQRYRAFVQCCGTSPDAGDQLDALQAEASTILEQSVKTPPLFTMASRIQALTVPVAQARDNLRLLQSQMDKLQKAKQGINKLDYEGAGQERRRIEEAEDSLNQLKPGSGPSIAPTGKDIGNSTSNQASRTGTDVGTSSFNSGSRTGEDVGASGSTGPRTGQDVGNSSFNGLSSTDTAIGNSNTNDNARVGSDIGSSGKNGPSFGNSSFNQSR